MADTDVGWAHAEGLAALLEGLPYRLFIGEVTDAGGPLEYPHLILWPPPATRPTVTLNGYAGEVTTTTQITAVGRDPREAITALDRASALLHRRRPTIEGRRCSVITSEPGAAGPPQPQRDEQARTPDGHPPYFTFAQFTLHSSPRSPDG
ncbi:hypothetical protein MED01_002392 [Micromonospora sp. MED01]|uniref:hypothetical protein n=1 Tax=Micromonospora alfalfae TaxID=2911212 RepID=UPI001EE8EB8F|nr:hypothetical protein [Micromonospora alfalfae]MCG5464227.1 hypothetical protein [Micromonospora alfalfae]